MQTWVLLSGFAAFAIVGVLLVDRSEKRRAVRHMAGRDPLSPAQFAIRYFSGDQIPIAEKLLGILSQHLSIDLSNLHPDDRLVEDLRMDALDSLSTVEFVLDVERALNVTIPNEIAEKMLTLRQVVEFVSARGNAEQTMQATCETRSPDWVALDFMKNGAPGIGDKT